MLLAFDVGNTNIVAGCFDDEELLFEFRLKTDVGRTVDEFELVLESLIQKHMGERRDVDTAIISSVVPPVTPDLTAIVKNLFDVEPLIVGPGIRTGLSIEIADPSTVGADRVVNAVAARELYGAPVIIVDFGTATTLDYVNPNGAYEGGIIAPGIEVSLDALVEHTAKLPRIEIAWPESVVGKSTTHAMQSGAVIGYLCLVDGLVDRVRKEVGPVETVVATGGLSELLTRYSQHISTADKHLTLKGMRVLAELNRR